MIRIKKAGWIYIFLTISLGIGAVNTGNNLIYIIVSAFLSFMILSGFFGKRNISNIDLNIELPEEIYASREAMIKIRLRNRKRFPPSFLIKIVIGDRYILYPFIDLKKDISGYLRITFPRRGVHKIEDVFICSVFPFNFFMRCRRLRLEREIIVFPEPKECNLGYDYEGWKRRGDADIEEKGYEGDLLSLRDYMPGDSMKYIHWKASAKTGQFKTKELSAFASRPTVIDVDKLSGRDIEERLSFATYLILRYSKMGLPFIVRVREKVFSIGTENLSFSRKEVLKELALY